MGKIRLENLSFFMARVSLADKAVLFENLSVMLRSGLAITESLEILISQNSGKLKNIIREVLKNTIAGNSLSSGLAKYSKIFPAYIINVLKAGEASGNLDNSLANIANQLSKEKDLISKIRGALVYPMIVLFMSIGLGTIITFVVLPKIMPIFKGLEIELPLSTQILIFAAEQIEGRGGILILGFIVILAFFGWLFKQKFVQPILDWLWLRLPIIKKISRGKNLARINMTLGTMLKSGLQLDQALDITSQIIDNYYFQKSIKKAVKGTQAGKKLSDSFREQTKLFPELMLGLVRVGEQSGKLEEEFFSLARIYEKEVDQATKTLGVVIEPVLLLMIGLIVGWLAISIITPIYQITGNVY